VGGSHNWHESQFTKIEPGKKSGWTSVGMTAPKKSIDRTSNVLQSQPVKVISEAGQDQTRSLKSGAPVQDKDDDEVQLQSAE
jgi:hypothetical protein